jgi:hypothetical protein
VRFVWGAAALSLGLAGPALAGSVKASSELKDADGVKHPASNAFDGLLNTGWAEAATGGGSGSWIEVSLDRPTEVAAVSIWPGNLSKGERSLKEFGRPVTVTVALIGGPEPVSTQVRLPELEKTGPTRVDIPVVGTAKTVRITMDDADPGYVFNDTFIAEIAVNFNVGTPAPEVAKVADWVASAAGQKAAAADKDTIVGLFDRISAAQFGDDEALDQLIVRASDGAPAVRAQAARTVPYGFRVHAIPPDFVAVDALLKLKDSNAIPAIQMAALRTTGKDSRTLALKAEMFEAYQEMVGGGRRNIPAWGIEGWEHGALRSFGEPMPAQVDRFGDLYVADVANNRVQRFGSRGIADKWFGHAEADITNAWIDGTRKYYASGSRPGRGAGELTIPLDIAMIPGKDADGFAVVDASKRVSLWDEAGNPTLSWDVRSDVRLDDGVGGEAYVEYVKGKLVVFWAGDAFVYSLEGEELATWEIEDGVPNGTVAFKNGKLGLVFGDSLIQYTIDGFRYGTIVHDELGEGFENWDVTLDERGKLWAVTDHGYVFKFKKPGKLDFSIPISDYSLGRPRLAAVDDFVFVVDDDKILRIDALETKARIEQEEADAAAAVKE